MSQVVVAQRMWQRRDTPANWASANPVLAAGEIGVELLTPPIPNRIKVGDGSTPWNSLPYFTGGAQAAAIGCTFNGGGAAIEAGAQCDIRVPYACTITKASIVADVSGDIAIDIWSDTYGNYPPTDADSIVAAAVPSIVGGVKYEDTTLTGWSKSIAAGTILRFNVDSCNVITRALLTLEVLKQ